MIEIAFDSPVPLNEQIKSGLRGLVAKGILRPGDMAPSIRNLAASLRVNPNTVARAFRELIMEGLLEARRGDGNYVAAAAERRAKDGLERARAGLREALEHARRAGLSWAEIEETLRRAKKGDE